MIQQAVDVHPPSEAQLLEPRLPRPVLARAGSLTADRSNLSPLFCFGGANAEGDVYDKVLRGLEPGRAVYVCCFPGEGGPADGNWFHRTFVSVASEYARYIREIQPHGPYFMCGYSLGARIVFDVARQFREAGESIGMAALLDAWAPGFPARLSRAQRALIHLRHLFGPGAVQYLKLRIGRVLHRVVRVAAKKVQSVTGRNTSAWGEQIPGRPAKLGMLAPPNYRPFVYDGDILFLRADLTPEWPGCDFSDPACGWTPYVRGELKVRRIQCRHLEVLSDPAAKEIGRLLDEQMRLFHEEQATDKPHDLCI